MRKPKYHSYYVVGFASELASSGMILGCFDSSGDGKRAFENTKMEMSKAAAAGEKFHGLDLPKKGFQAIRLVKVMK